MWTCFIGWLFILRHFLDLTELRGFADSLRQISFLDERLLVGERVDYLAFPSPSKRGGKRTGAGRPRGGCRGGRGGSRGGRGGGGSGGVGGAGGLMA